MMWRTGSAATGCGNAEAASSHIRSRFAPSAKDRTWPAQESGLGGGDHLAVAYLSHFGRKGC